MVMEAMKIPKGYKQTEVGVIPEDWILEDFGNVVNYIKGYAFKSSEYTNDGIRVIRVSDTTFDSIEDINAVFVSENSRRKYKKWELKENDLIFSTVGSKPPMYDSLVGKAVIVTKKHSGSFLNQNAVLIRSRNCSDDFQKLLLNHFRTERYIEYIEIIYRGNANQASITLENLFQYKLPLPKSEKEQTAIANALSDVDELLASLEKLSAKKRAIKTAAMQQLLTGKKRLPEFEKHPNGKLKGYKQTELGEVPEDWELSQIKQLCSYQNGRTQEHLFNNQYGFIVISIGNYSERGKFVHTSTYIDKSHESSIRKYILNKNDLAMILNDKTSVGTIIGRVLLIQEDDQYVINQRTMRLTPIGKVDADYLYFLLNSDFVHKRIVGLAKPGTQIYINTNDVTDFLLAHPVRKEEQIAIANVLSDMDKDIETLENRLAKTRQIKQGMMQELLTGRVRLV